jgi:hypothetical protein
MSFLFYVVGPRLALPWNRRFLVLNARRGCVRRREEEPAPVDMCIAVWYSRLDEANCAGHHHTVAVCSRAQRDTPPSVDRDRVRGRHAHSREVVGPSLLRRIMPSSHQNGAPAPLNRRASHLAVGACPPACQPPGGLRASLPIDGGKGLGGSRGARSFTHATRHYRLGGPAAIIEDRAPDEVLQAPPTQSRRSRPRGNSLCSPMKERQP